MRSVFPLASIPPGICQIVGAISEAVGALRCVRETRWEGICTFPASRKCNAATLLALSFRTKEGFRCIRKVRWILLWYNATFCYA